MLVQTEDKQRRAASVVKTALLSAGIHNRSICIHADSWSNPFNEYVNYGVFVSSPDNTEPFFVTGKTLVEAVRKMIDSIKKKRNVAYPVEITEEAPF